MSSNTLNICEKELVNVEKRLPSLDTELGASLRAAGWERQTRVAARQWDTPSRRREYKPIRDRWRWSIGDLSKQPARIQYEQPQSDKQIPIGW